MESVYFPPGKAGNILRGALGAKLPFERSGSGPSGLADPPRPFVLRAAHLDGKQFEPGEKFSLNVNIFDSRTRDSPGSWTRIFVHIFAEWADTGLGPRRGRVELCGNIEETQVALDLAPGPEASKCSVAFLTPTELKGNSDPGAMPFGVLFARVRDRLSTLRSLYGEGPLPIDFRDLSHRAALVRTVRCQLEYREVLRRSSRTGSVHGIGGVTGSVDYEGALTEFLPYLQAAWWTGVGRHTVWGNGVIQVAAGG